MRRVLCSLFLVLNVDLDSSTAFADPIRSQLISAVPLSPPPSVTLSRHGTGETFFDIEDSAPPSTDRATRPRRVRVYWDHSAARIDDGLEAEANLLVRYLDTVHPGIVDLVLFSGGPPEVKIIEAPQEAAQLAGILNTLRYDGTAAAHEILDLALPPADACLYFSDGGVPVDPADAERIRCPLFVVSSAEDANRGLLRVLARRSAGAHFDLSTTSADDAVLALTGSLPRVVNVTSSDGRAIDYALLPSGPDRFRIVGPVPVSGAIVVTLASGAKRTRTYAIKGLAAPRNDGIGVLWAVDRLHEFIAADHPESERILALARRYSLEAALPTN